MHLSNENILQFQKLYKEQFGIELSKEEAYENGAKLLRLVQLIYKPMTKAEFVKAQKEVEAIRDRINKRNEM